jgi:hypothetical protein
MKKYNLIITSTLGLFIIFGLFLAYTETKSMDLANAKTWWTAYFQNPKSNDLSFTIENHSATNLFHWELVSGNSSPTQGDETIANNHIKNISVTQSPDLNQKITIIITHGNDKKEIYKNF